MSAHKLIIQNIKLHYGKTKLGESPLPPREEDEKYRDITELIKLLKLISLLISIL